MEDSRKYRVYPSELDVLNAFRRLRDHLIEAGFKEDSVACQGIEYVIYVDRTRSLTGRNYDEFLRAFEPYPQALPIRIHSHWRRDNKEPLACKIRVEKEEIDATIESPDPHTLSAVHEKIREYFSASNPDPDRSERISRGSLKKSVFLAHRFDKYGSTTAATLRTFLTRLGFDIKEGEGYEASSIPDKVTERIRSQDILICLVTPGDPSRHRPSR